MGEITINKAPKVSIYELCPLANLDLALLPTRRLKEWINQVIALKKSYKFNNINQVSGGNHDQATNY